MKAAGSLILAASTDRVLLLRRADGQGWDQPGGMMEEDEDEPAATACRELDEETEEFEPTLSAEHTASGWFDLETLPEGVHPGTALAIDVLRRKGF